MACVCFCRLPNGQVDFAHFAELAEKMSELMVWTRAKCPFEKDQGLALLLQTSPVLSPKGEQAFFCSLSTQIISSLKSCSFLFACSQVWRRFPQVWKRRQQTSEKEPPPRPNFVPDRQKVSDTPHAVGKNK